MASQEVFSRRRRVSFNQLESLWEFLNSHRDIAVGFNKSAQAREYSKRMWTDVSDTLNSMGEGATKDWKGWSNYWIDYKAKLKKRVASIRLAQNRTGGGPSEATPLSEIERKMISLLGEDFGSGLATPLSEIERKMISLLGEDFGSGLPNTQVDPFPDLTQLIHVVSEPSLELAPEPAPEPVQEPAPEPAPVEETETPQQQHLTEERSRRHRRSRRQAISQQMAREILIDISRNRLLAEQQNVQHLDKIANTLERNAETQLQILAKLDEIASSLERGTGPRRPESRGEGAS